VQAEKLSPNYEKPPVDPGCLPAWKMDDFPVPVPMSWKNLLAMLGPGLVMIGGTIGTGEWVVGAGVAALYGGAFLWVAPLAILCQVMLNTEAMRYTLVTGEPVFTGFLRSKPGPKFWLLCYLLLDIVGWMPALAGLAAQIVLFTINGQKTPDPFATRMMAIAILLLCGTLLCFGRKVYNMLEVVLGGKVLFVLFYLLTVTLLFVPGHVWGRVASGMVNPFQVPEGGIQWGLIGSVAGLAGIGGLGNILASNFVREKGWGMGSKVGAIGSAVGGEHVTLDHIGTMARPDEEGVRRFSQWWNFIKLDQFGLWAWGSVVGMMLPCVLGAGFIRPDHNYFGKSVGELAAATTLAREFGAAKGSVFLILTLICGAMIMLPGQFSSMDGIARRWCDAFWSGSTRAHALGGNKAKVLYYSFVVTYVAIGVLVYAFPNLTPTQMMVFNANLANLSICCCILHTLYVNSRFLPKAFQPSRLKRAGLVVAACFYFGLFCLATNQTIEKAKAGTLFPKPAAASR
jgi:hypothetical protein